MKTNVLLLNKPVGITPFQRIEEYKKTHPSYKNIKLGFAGRLDPMAEGLLVVLVGEENKRKKLYEDLPKTYEFSALFGVSTDSYDVLGLPASPPLTSWKQADTSLVKDYLNSLPGTYDQPYPPYSSKTVQGKPLYKWAREGKLSAVTLPTRSISIYSATFESTELITASDLLTRIQQRIIPLQGVFRQNEILTTWKSVLTPLSDESFTIINATVSCSSGTYIRSIVHNMGIFIKKGAIALRIKRTQVGDYSLSDAEGQ